MRKLCFFTFVIMLLCAISLWGESGQRYLSIKVRNSWNTVDCLILKCEDMGGYSVYSSDSSAQFRVPVKEEKDFYAFIRENALEILSDEKNSYDSYDRITLLKEKLVQKKSLLVKYSETLDSADWKTALEIEKAMLDIINETESIQGEINYLEECEKTVLFTVGLESEASSAVLMQAVNFPWIEHIEFQNFITWKNTEKNPEFSRRKAKIPGNFALEAESFSLLRGVSPEGCKFALEKLENYPVKEISFWEKIIEKDFLFLGYTLVEKMELNGKSGKVLCYTWKVPGVYYDFTYITAFNVSGKKISVMTAGGNEKDFLPYVDEIKMMAGEL